MSCGMSRRPPGAGSEPACIEPIRLFPAEPRRADPDADRARRFLVEPFAVRGPAALKARLAALTAAVALLRPPCEVYELNAFRAALANPGGTEQQAARVRAARGPGAVVVSHISTVAPAPAIVKADS